MKIGDVIPTPTAIVREALIVIGGLVLAAAIIKMIPALQRHTASASITLKDADGNVLF